MVSEIKASVKLFFIIILNVYAILRHLTATELILTASEDSRQSARGISIAAAAGMDLFARFVLGRPLQRPLAARPAGVGLENG
jgi:hypothetical protein